MIREGNDKGKGRKRGKGGREEEKGEIGRREREKR